MLDGRSRGWVTRIAYFAVVVLTPRGRRIPRQLVGSRRDTWCHAFPRGMVDTSAKMR